MPDFDDDAFLVHLAARLMPPAKVAEALQSGSRRRLGWQSKVFVEVDDDTLQTTSTNDAEQQVVRWQTAFDFQPPSISLQISAWLVQGTQLDCCSSHVVTRQEWLDHFGALRVDLAATPVSELAQLMATAMLEEPKVQKSPGRRALVLYYQRLGASAPLTVHTEGGDHATMPRHVLDTLVTGWMASVEQSQPDNLGNHRWSQLLTSFRHKEPTPSPKPAAKRPRLGQLQPRSLLGLQSKGQSASDKFGKHSAGHRDDSEEEDDDDAGF